MGIEMDEKTLKIFFEIHKDLPREGPGSFKSTERAYNTIRKHLKKPMILDVGCGPGKQTIDLLNISDGEITAVDNHKPFIDQLEKEIIKGNFSNRVTAKVGDMFNLDFKEEQFDLIWCEGAIYNIGFEKGLSEFRKFLKPKGFIAATEACWLTNNISKEAKIFWDSEYPAIIHLEDNLKIAEECGYKIIDHFVLEKSAWFNDYYNPIIPRLAMLKEKYAGDETAEKIIHLHEKEIEIMDKYSNEVGYVFFILQKNDIIL
jgi:ubiquinone/menaquinone biosynthesis C-methylase UbiE